MIGIIGCAGLRSMQYLYFYTDFFDKNGIEYDVLYWNRTNDPYSPNFNGEKLCFKTNPKLTRYLKYFYYLKFRKFVIQAIKKKKYEKLIILTSQTAFLFKRILLNKFKNKFVYDFRDTTRENRYFYKKQIKKLISASRLVAFSSPGFLKQLNLETNSKFFVIHNLIKYDKVIGHKRDKHDSIVISYWGYIRQIAFLKKICNFFKDSRFILNFYGRGRISELKKYCFQKRIKNVVFYGEYTKDNIPKMCAETDILLCLYKNDYVQKNAMPVKFYDGILNNLPMLVSAGSFIDYRYNKFLGVMPFTFNNKTVDILEWYSNIDYKRIENEYQIILNAIYEDGEKYKRALILFSKL